MSVGVLDDAGLPPSVEGGPPTVIDMALLDQVPCAAELGPFAMLEERVWIRCQDPELAAFLEAFLAAFPAVAEHRTRLDLVEVHGRMAAYENGVRATSAADVGSLARSLSWHLNRLALNAPSADVYVHAAVASRDGRALIFPGRSGAGKTTLVTALLLAGWTYLSDEVAAVGPEGAVVGPYPRPLALEEGSWDLLPEAARGWPAGVPRLVADRWFVLPGSLGSREPAAPAHPAAVVFPEVVPGRPMALEPLHRAESLQRLLGHSLNAHGTGREGFDRLAGLVRRTTSHRLVLDGVAGVDDLLAPLVRMGENVGR